MEDIKLKDVYASLIESNSKGSVVLPKLTNDEWLEWKRDPRTQAVFNMIYGNILRTFNRITLIPSQEALSNIYFSLQGSLTTLRLLIEELESLGIQPDVEEDQQDA
jgi:hypothetical protein